ncbi:expressed unknown protein [Seminavis robusta]|uniref:Uncharacterized protein n=1 Tax=Seminavis robusta TaxID=568900 RepID=A0A9N8EXW5_9STRA|nr:expressed unknown protein [Seminavis robusta]|eukprot:Sro2035_g312050.1 n/a (255) ;mRNA; f:4775-5680
MTNYRFWDHEPAKFVAAYIISGLLAILIPGINHAKSVKRYQNSYYYQYNNQYDDQDQNGSGDLPSWFSGWNGNAYVSGDSQDGSSANSGAIKFVYTWELLMFLGLLAYGGMVLFKFRGPLAQSRMALWSLFVLIFVWANFAFMTMWLVANGSIYTDGREMEEVGGFYNQFSVLLFVTNFWYLMWSICFCIALGVRIFRKAGEEVINETKKPGDSMNYLPYSEPSVTATGVSTLSLPLSSTGAPAPAPAPKSSWW